MPRPRLTFRSPTISTPNHRKPVGRILPNGTQTSSFWLDESGSKTTAGKCFVVGGIKTRHPDPLQREIHSIREQHSYDGEFKFSKVNERNIRRFYDLVDVLESSDVRLVATIVDGGRYNPFKGRAQWEAHAGVISQLVIAAMNKNEIATVIVDGISTPPGCSVGRNIKRGVNSKLRTTAVVQAFCLDSRANDLLQAADLVTGAIFNQRSGKAREDSPKDRLARRLASAFGVPDLSDHRKGRVTFATLEAPRSRSRRLTVVKASSSSA